MSKLGCKKRSIAGFIIIYLAFINQAHAMTSWNEFLPQPLVKSDMEQMKEAARVELSEKEPGTTVEWHNPETNLKGTVTLIKNFDIKDKQCRGIVHQVMFSPDEILQFDGTLCQGSQGHWEVLPFTFLNR